MKTTEKPLEKPLRTFAKLGFSYLETAEIVNALNKLLANYHIHYQKLRNFHWNVEGPDFFELHEKFEEQYKEVRGNIDLVAERIRVFGQRPMSNLKEYLKASEIKEVDETEQPITSYQMVKEILNDFEILLSFMVDVNDSANKISDVGTIDMMTTFIKKMEKNHWMYSAWLKNQSNMS